MTLPCRLPADWIDWLFGEFAVTYGEAFMRQYGAIDAGVVKARWAEKLAGFAAHTEALHYGVAHLPKDAPPNVLQFIDICKRAPSAVPALTWRPAVASAEVIAQVRCVFAGWRAEADPRGWATRLRLRHSRGERLTPAQVDAYRHALGLDAPAAADDLFAARAAEDTRP